MHNDNLISSYFVIAFRALTRNKLHLILNVVGLSVGLAAALLVGLYALHESSYDKFQPNAETTYRVVSHNVASGNEYPMSSPSAHKIMQKFNGVEDTFALLNGRFLIDKTVKVADEYFRVNHSYAATDNIQDFIALNVLVGDLKQALSQPDKIALSESEAIRFFGTIDATGQVLAGKDKNWTVAAVFSDLQHNSHFAFESLISAQPYMDAQGNVAHSYIRVNPAADVEKISNSVSQLMADIWKTDPSETVYRLQPIIDIHLAPNLKDDLKVGGSMSTFWISIALCILLLFIASFNSVNMNIAQAGFRAKEVGVRKALGATKPQLVIQFLSESIILASVSAIIASALVEMLLPSFSQLVSREIHVTSWAPFALSLIGVTVLIGLLSGLYPALFISSFNVKRVLSGDFQRGESAIIIRKMLVVLQSALSIALIIASVTLYLQLNFLQDLPVNYSKENRLRVTDVDSNVIYELDNQHILKDLAQVEGISAATAIDFDLTKSVNAGIMNIANIGQEPFLGGTGYGGVGFNAVETLGLELVAGRDFSADYQSDWYNKETKTLGILVSESTIVGAGFDSPEDAVGKVWQFIAGGAGKVNGKIVGVVRDMKLGSVKDGAYPVTLGCGLSWTRSGSIMVKIDGLSKEATKARLSEFMRTRLNINVVEIENSLAKYQALYGEEIRLVKMVSIFSALAICLTCVGMFGLAAFSAQRRNREVAIRKVLGASRISLVSLLVKDSMMLVLIGCLIAYPSVYYFINDWLNSFSQRVDQSALIYILAGMSIAAITLITISAIAFRASGMRPSMVLHAD